MLALSQIENKDIRGTIDLPLSKSILNRHLIMHAMENKYLNDDITSAGNDVVLLQKAIESKTDVFDFEDAGTPVRLFIAYAAYKGLNMVIDGSARLQERPLKPLLDALMILGAEFEFFEKPGQLPLRIVKPIDRTLKNTRIDASQSSQFISALMLIGPYLDNGLSIEIKGKRSSAPYIDLTASCMRNAGVEVSDSGYEIKVEKGRYDLNGLNAEADWSAAGFIYAWAALSDSCDILLKGLRIDSAQGDSRIVQIFESLGVKSKQEKDGVRIVKTDRTLTALMELDIAPIPDQFPLLAAVCMIKRLELKLLNTAILRLKESDRIAAILNNFSTYGLNCDFGSEDSMHLSYEGDVPELMKFSSFNDHRIAMACSLFAFTANVSIDDETVVKKSFPSYWELFNSVLN